MEEVFFLLVVVFIYCLNGVGFAFKVELLMIEFSLEKGGFRCMILCM